MLLLWLSIQFTISPNEWKQRTLHVLYEDYRSNVDEHFRSATFFFSLLRHCQNNRRWTEEILPLLSYIKFNNQHYIDLTRQQVSQRILQPCSSPSRITDGKSDGALTTTHETYPIHNIVFLATYARRRNNTACKHVCYFSLCECSIKLASRSFLSFVSSIGYPYT
jgi:hypothetical protein